MKTEDPEELRNRGNIVKTLFLRRHYTDQVQGFSAPITPCFGSAVSGRGHPLGIRSGLCEAAIPTKIARRATNK